MNDEKLIEKYYNKISKIISYDDFISKINDKKNLLGDLCDEEMCIQLVLNDLNMLNEYELESFNSFENIDDNKVKKTIKELKEIKDNKMVSFSCKIIFMNKLKEFIKKDNTKGYLLSLFVADNTDKIKINVWNEKIKMISDENIKVGSTVDVNGFLNINNDNIEININNNCSIVQSKENIDIINKDIKIKDISVKNENINVKGKIIFIKEIKSFLKKNNKEGKLKQFLIGDDTGTIMLNLWDNQIDENSTLNIGDSIEIKNVNIKKNNYTNSFELSLLKNFSEIKKLNYDIPYEIIFKKIGKIQDLEYNINVIGKIIDISEIKSFTKKDGNEGVMGNIIIGDETGKIILKLWNNNTTYLDYFNFNDVISIQNCFSKINDYTKQIELNISYNSILQKENKNIEYIENNTTINDMIPGHIYNIIGEIINKENDDLFQEEKYKITITDDNSNSIDIFYNDYQKDTIEQLRIGEKINITNVLACKDNNKNIYLIMNKDSFIN